MYTDKKNILQLAALLKAHHVQKIVLCPGSRNIPIVQTLANMPDFTCYPMTDERSAGFFALGLALHGGQPAAVCCTSGSALLNIHPAVAEAYYQQVPLIVISADRPEAWIGQMDGQTLPQPSVFGKLVKKSVQLPEIQNEEDEWYCNRLINEALMEVYHHGRGPVHINVPVSEPFFDFPTLQLPEVRVITRYQGLNMYDRDYQPLIERLNQYHRRMAIAGQMNLIYLFDKQDSKLVYKHFTWITENLSNKTIPGLPIQHIDALLASMSEEKKKQMRPDLVITYGGHIISKQLKKFLRQHPPKEHWHVSKDGEVADLFGALTTVIEMDPFEFLERIAPLLKRETPEYPRQWENLSKAFVVPHLPYSEMGAIERVIAKLPSPCALHLSNSSTVRYAQLFNLPADVEVLSNRGVNGIEGCLSTALGYAAASGKLNFIFIGDLSFFYDMNALWSSNYGSNIRILLLNNHGGEIFHALPGLDLADHVQRFVVAPHQSSAKAWAEDRNFEYLSATGEEELNEAVNRFTEPSVTSKPMLLEVFTEKEKDSELLKEFYQQLKNK